MFIFKILTLIIEIYILNDVGVCLGKASAGKGMLENEFKGVDA